MPRISRLIRASILFALLPWACVDLSTEPPVTPNPPVPPPPRVEKVPWIRLATSDGAVTSELTQGVQPAWSPDGRRIAFVRDGRIHVIDRDGTNHTDLARGRWPAWSPDGSRIAFTNDQGISVMNADGSGLRLLVPHGFRDLRYSDVGVGYPAWSPDGATLAFIHFGEFDGFEPSRLFTTPADRFEPRMLLEHEAEDINPLAPAWSPDGKRMAIVSATFGIAVFDVADADSHPSIFTTLPRGLVGSSPQWTAGGDAISYTRQVAEPPGSAIYLIPSRGGTARLLLSDAEDAVWSPDGRHVAFVRRRVP